MIFPTYKFEEKKIHQGYKFVAGCDEAGIGPLAGPVVAVAVILNLDLITHARKNKWWARVRDSKKVSEIERENLFKLICDHALDFSVAAVTHETIDKINILKACLLAHQKAIMGLKQRPDFIFIDGVHKMKQVGIPQQAVIRGDSKLLSIACASILAKVTRDKIMRKFHLIYPRYNFMKHKGYPTREHRMLIKKFGPCPIHRKSFKLV